MENQRRINYVNEYWKEKYGERTLKIGIDGGFTCPNRDGTKGTTGCLFCSERGSGEHLSSLSIKEQLEQYFQSYRSHRANSFILYFQNYSNTYDSIENLKMKYDTAIFTANHIIKEKYPSKRIVGMNIATRPDCINEEICKLLSSYATHYDISVELGLQTANDTTRELLHCGYTTEDFQKANHLLHQYHISVISHIMVGLPNETHQDIINTVHFLNQQNVEGVKIHSTYIVKNTELEKQYQNKKYSPIELEEYLSELTYIITHLNPQIVIHRISGDAPKDLLVAPQWNAHKKWVLNRVVHDFHEKNYYQGMYFCLNH